MKSHSWPGMNSAVVVGTFCLEDRKQKDSSIMNSFNPETNRKHDDKRHLPYFTFFRLGGGSMTGTILFVSAGNFLFNFRYIGMKLFVLSGQFIGLFLFITF